MFLVIYLIGKNKGLKILDMSRRSLHSSGLLVIFTGQLNGPALNGDQAMTRKTRIYRLTHRLARMTGLARTNRDEIVAKLLEQYDRVEIDAVSVEWVPKS